MQVCLSPMTAFCPSDGLEYARTDDAQFYVMETANARNQGDRLRKPQWTAEGLCVSTAMIQLRILGLCLPVAAQVAIIVLVNFHWPKCKLQGVPTAMR
jgi:hypothetical protein